VLRLRQAVLVTENLEAAVADLEQIFGLAVAYQDPGVAQFGLVNAVLPVGSQFIEVVCPTRDGTAAGRYLAKRKGPGGYMVALECDDPVARRARASELGVRVPMRHRSDSGYDSLQLHPADTGGSFLTLEFQPGGEDPLGPWTPAGPNWRRAVRTDYVTGFRAAEIQAADPLKVARRWSEILEFPLQLSKSGTSVDLRLDHETSLRFVATRDDRGDGLAALEMTARDPQAVRRVATARGCVDGDGVINVCGTRILLNNPG
jgi:hypothetical protein